MAGIGGGPSAYWNPSAKRRVGDETTARRQTGGDAGADTTRARRRVGGERAGALPGPEGVADAAPEGDAGADRDGTGSTLAGHAGAAISRSGVSQPCG